ncbi:MAG: hypothetical protein ACJATN_000739 [Neolewinella sp.]|jgi:hypothetical protein
MKRCLAETNYWYLSAACQDEDGTTTLTSAVWRDRMVFGSFMPFGAKEN